ncbi:hypothetical protein Ahy_A03g015943 isoform G [Arachis hypogaea]|uniref:NB-ARC domain-containing protein n=1 Tax=Arachis hypogaea TaxID=3818 RepID=A0A445E1W6_ARAHY|nr:hypothetical protein Ahy_A03g015943 isoform G [Arachis hypogaea]
MVGVLVSALLPAALQVLIDRLASRQLLDLFSRRTIAASAAAAAAEKLKLQLLSVNAVLADAEEKQIVNPYVKIWVDELRETVYHGQDLLDQIATEVLRLNLASKSNTAMEWVREFLDSITSKLNSSLDEINIRIQVLRDQKDCLGLRERHEKQSQLELGSADLMYVPTTRMVDQSKVYGRDQEKDEIIRLMFAAMSEQVDPVCVVAIVGMAGIGKTTLSQLLFNDPRLVPMFDTLSWIQVSAGSDVLHLTKKVCESMSDNLDTLQVELNRKLRRQRLLLVLDDFWSVSFSDWELFKMAFSHAIPGSVILVTTRNGDVATTIRAAVTYFLSPLPYEDCWDLSDFYITLYNRKLEAFAVSESFLYKDSRVTKLYRVLLLAHCDCLTSLPKDLENLTDLHHLDVTGAPLVEMPPNFGRLKLLRHLTTFIVGKSTGSRISELGALSQLHGLLSIVNLQNVIDATEASGANLMMKTFIDELVFEWTNDVHNLSKEAIVLYNLQPHKNLKRLEIENYGGRTFPEWLGNPLFSNLVSVQLIGCISCLTLPPLGQLNSLKTLLIAKMTWLERVGLEFYGNTNSPFRVLEVLTFKDMHRWKEWLQIDIEECFPSLEELHIQNCPKLTGNLPQRLSSLNKLVIAKCSINSLPRVPMLRELELFDCDELMSLPTEMMQGNEHISKVSIYNCSSLKYVPALGLPIRLESLYIGKCRNLKLYPEEHMIEHLHLEDSCDSLIILSLSSFSWLRHLHIQGCPNLGSLSISNEFTEELYHLEKIQLKDCPNLVFFPYGGLRTPNLQVLSISNCKKLAPQKEWGLHEMLSLSYFGIEGELTGLESFPDEGLLPACLTDLHIMGLEDLTSLNHDGLQHLVALKNLVIEGCSMLEFLPSQGLPGSLSNLIIADCPLLVPLCQFETGAYWPLIAHIPNKDIV